MCCGAGECSSSNLIQLTDRELAVCQMICTSSEPVTFSHVKRSVDLHQEILSRILKRLLNYRVIRKENRKYSCIAGQ
ncbi:MAG TPA: hypothetical protein VEC02_02515 [Nitrososphaerales archaeon]|nr:hypothetical protein [Nitrososphaerales archaeon]